MGRDLVNARRQRREWKRRQYAAEMDVDAYPPKPDDCPLQDREWQVLMLTRGNRSPKVVALALGLSSVYPILARARFKLKAKTNAQARDYALLGLWPAAKEDLSPAEKLMLVEVQKYLISGEAVLGVPSEGMDHHLKSLAMEQGVPVPPGRGSGPWTQTPPWEKDLGDLL